MLCYVIRPTKICVENRLRNSGRFPVPTEIRRFMTNIRSKNNSEFRIPNSELNFKGFCKIVHLFVNERIDESSFGGIFLGENFALNADRVEQ